MRWMIPLLVQLGVLALSVTGFRTSGFCTFCQEEVFETTCNVKTLACTRVDRNISSLWSIESDFCNQCSQIGCGCQTSIEKISCNCQERSSESIPIAKVPNPNPFLKTLALPFASIYETMIESSFVADITNSK